MHSSILETLTACDLAIPERLPIHPSIHSFVFSCHCSMLANAKRLIDLGAFDAGIDILVLVPTTFQLSDRDRKLGSRLGVRYLEVDHLGLGNESAGHASQLNWWVMW